MPPPILSVFQCLKYSRLCSITRTGVCGKCHSVWGQPVNTVVFSWGLIGLLWPASPTVFLHGFVLLINSRAFHSWDRNCDECVIFSSLFLMFPSLSLPFYLFLFPLSLTLITHEGTDTSVSSGGNQLEAVFTQIGPVKGVYVSLIIRAAE